MLIALSRLCDEVAAKGKELSLLARAAPAAAGEDLRTARAAVEVEEARALLDRAADRLADVLKPKPGTAHASP